VTLFERRPVLGGQVRLWAKAPSRRELIGIIDWLAARLAEQPVDVRLRTAPDAADLAGFDAVVIATGATGLKHGHTPLHPARWAGPPLPGTDQDTVLSYHEYLEREPALGPQVIVADAMGGRQGAVVAEVLASRGHAVEMVTQLPQPSPDLAASRDWGKVHGMLRKMGVRFTVDSEIVAIAGNRVTIRDVYTGETAARDVAGVVYVLGAAAEDALFHDLAPLRRPGTDLVLIGDALAPRRVDAAIREGELAARAI
jgi:NADPH-dependent 2,4-dienoyl-CoA reductase/sulfur reductase-like enzyme